MYRLLGATVWICLVTILPKATDSRILELIKQLGNDDFYERETASRTLEVIGEPALESLEHAIIEDPDLEIRTRARSAVDAIKSKIYHELKCFQGHTAPVRCLTVSPDGKWLLSGSNDMTVRLWDVGSGVEKACLIGHTGDVTSVAFSHDCKKALSGSFDNTMRLWDVVTGKLLHCYRGHQHTIIAVAFSLDGAEAWSSVANITTTQDQTVRRWNLATEREIVNAQDFSRTFLESHLVPASDRMLLASASGGLSLWELKSLKEIRRFNGLVTGGGSAVLDRDATQALSVGRDGTTLHLWNVVSGEELRRFKGHTDTVTSVAFSPDGRQCLSGSWDKTMRLWDVERGNEVYSFHGHTDTVLCVGFSPDGKRVFSGGADCTIRLWRRAK